MTVTYDTRIHPNVIFNLTVPHTNGPWRAVLEFPAERLQPRTLLHRAWAWLTAKASPPTPRNVKYFVTTATGQVAIIGPVATPQPAPRHRSLFFTNDTTGGPVAPPPVQVDFGFDPKKPQQLPIRSK